MTPRGGKPELKQPTCLSVAPGPSGALSPAFPRSDVVAAAAWALRAAGPERTALRRAADEVRAATVGPVVHLRALIEFSNRCVQRCLYCGLRRDNAALERYALEPDNIVHLALEAARAGYATVVLQSGEDPAYTCETIARVVGRIKDAQPGLAVTLSVGERPRRDYAAWRAAGADRYLLKHETSDPVLYASLRPGRRLEQRLRCAEWLRELGYEVGLGNIVGLPGQTEASLVGDLELLARFEPEMVGVGPFIPHPDTPLAGAAPGSADLTVDFLALTRLLLPRANLPATTALATLDRAARVEALRAGANVLMVNVGPTERRRLYAIYPHRDDGALTSLPEAARATSLDAQRRAVCAWLAGLGRPVDTLRGEERAGC
ncbi:MAG: [FeFe] hydrogenase H-cluster radical SAM maturase HydE [Firmicutes bacterium]|nr:[FeFe] hydrogenase H-cluster radical SAM maturase HydE [Bacillota bacterium]